jgi:hypothetical protein
MKEVLMCGLRTIRMKVLEYRDATAWGWLGDVDICTVDMGLFWWERIKYG